MSADVNLSITGRVESLHLEPGDRVLVTIDDPRIGSDRIEELRDALKREFAPHEIVVLYGIRVGKERRA